jgi:hypothetical protein
MTTHPDLPSHELKEKLLARVRDTPRLSTSQFRARAVVILALALSLSAAFFYWRGGLRQAPRPTILVLETALGAFVIATITWWTALGRGGSMVGRPARVLVSLAVLTPVALFLWKVIWSTQDAGMMGAWSERPGFRCLYLSLATGIWPLLAMLALREGTDPNHPAVTGAAMGVAAAACAWVFVDLWCPVAYVPHLMLGHVLPMAILGSVGALLGRFLLRVRRI